MFHAIGDESPGYKKEEDGRNERKADKGGHQFRSELGPQNFTLPLKDQFDQIPDHQEDQKENQDDVDIDQAEDDDIIGDRNLPPDLREFQLDRCKDENEEGDDPNDDQLIAPSSCFGGKCLLHP
jgi:hypothetical protein